VPDAKIERSDVTSETQQISTRLRLSGALRGTGDTINASVGVALRLSSTGHVEAAEATIDAADLQKIRDARLRP
jgi:hypothetical protein